MMGNLRNVSNNITVIMFKYLLSVCLMILIISGCKEIATEPLDKGDAAPGPVKNVQVKSIPGGAVITYARPENMLYVKATYSIREGVEKEVKASYYKDSLTIEGFPDTKEHEVKLYAVSRGETSSEPVIIKVTPLTPPVQSVFKSLQLEEVYGGVRLWFTNEAQADVVINLLMLDSIGDFVPADIFYTKRKEGYVTSRGLAPVKRKFAAFIRDRWNNHSDTLQIDLTPLFEKQLDKSKFKEVRLPTDTYEQHCCGTGMVNLWDNSWNSGNVFHTKPGTGLAQWFTFDLGVESDLSRFKFYHRLGDGQQSTNGAYAGGDPKLFELWGSNEPNLDGSWGSWTLIGEFESIKPSGSPQGTVTGEDFLYAVVNGEEFDIPPGTPSFRYIRWRTSKVWGALDHHYIAELTFWGNDKSNLIK